MKIKTLFQLTCLAALTAAAPVHAVSISLLPANQMTNVGDNVSIDVLMDFTGDPTLGGGIDIFYDDSILDFLSFTFNPGLGSDPAFTRQPDDLAGELNGLAFGEFNGLEGPATVGTLLFTAIGQGTTNLTLADNDAPAGGFLQANSPFGPQTVDYTGAAVSSVVPLPGAAWLLPSGLIPLAARTRRKACRAEKR